ncbi:MAG: hypothetical protein IJY57_05450 [Clostridia bacterium]|nr:hypothetical protein [Clostridia bacterium]
MKVFKKILCLIIASVMLLGVTACGGGGGKEASCEISFAEYEGVEEVTNLETYQSGVNTNRAVEEGVILSPYYTLKVNEIDVPVYATRATYDIHSFVYIDVIDTEDEGFNLNLEITGTDESTVFRPKKAKVTVLPESTGVEAELNRDDKTVVADIDEYGSYSFAFNEDHIEPLTIMVKEQIDTDELFDDYNVVKVPVGDYANGSSADETVFTEENTVYYFSEGRYKIDSIVLPSNSILYTEMGAYLELCYNGSQKHAIDVEGTESNKMENVKVVGRGLIDYSGCNGSWLEGQGENFPHQKSHLWFWWVDGLEVAGMTVINSTTWTVYIESCKNIHVHDMLLIAYRTYADGIMLSNCVDGVVEKSFARTGDDAFEVKSRNASSQLTDNILFQYCAAWTDKALAYGIVYECHNDTRNVTFKDCSVGFALGDWSPHLGCCCIQLGEQARPERVNENITFENIEIFFSQNKALLNCYVGGLPARHDDGSGYIRNIYFKNITAKLNLGKVLYLETYDDVDCGIEDLYLDNIQSNGIDITSSNIENYMEQKVVGEYDLSKLHINTRG